MFEVVRKRIKNMYDLHSAFVDPSLGCCTFPYSYYLVAQQNFADLLLVAVVATYIVGLAFVVGALASDDTDPFDGFVASFASNSRQNRRHQMMACGMSK